MKKQLLVAPLLAIFAAAPLHAATASPPKPAGNPGEWITPGDYPSAALRAGKEGTVRFTVQVGADGVPAGCAVAQGSGDSSLDEATCRLISQRARFTPATDTKGRAVAGSYTNSVRWVVPEGGAQVQRIVVDPRLYAPAYCLPVWQGDSAAALAQVALALCANN